MKKLVCMLLTAAMLLGGISALAAEAPGGNVLVDGAAYTAAYHPAKEGSPWTEGYFRLADLAVLLRGTPLAFDMAWDPEAGQLAITRGADYTGERPDDTHPEGGACSDVLYVDALDLLINDTLVTVSACVCGDSCYISTRGLGLILGTRTAEEDGVLTLSTAETEVQPLYAPVMVNGVEHSAAVIVTNGKHFYRLRDIAAALIGSPYAIDVTWDRQIYVTRGRDYSEPLPAPLEEVTEFASDPQLVMLDDGRTTVNSLLMAQHFYIPYRCLNKLTGAAAWEIDGRLFFPDPAE